MAQSAWPGGATIGVSGSAAISLAAVANTNGWQQLAKTPLSAAHISSAWRSWLGCEEIQLVAVAINQRKYPYHRRQSYQPSFWRSAWLMHAQWRKW
jgi:hypothetical protein